MLLMKKLMLLFVLIVVILVVFSPDMAAQCPMCKMSAESNLRDGGTAGKGLNTGILYMLALPYILISTLGYLWYRNRKNYDKSGQVE
jgi:hypothetical protein